MMHGRINSRVKFIGSGLDYHAMTNTYQTDALFLNKCLGKKMVKRTRDVYRH